MRTKRQLDDPRTLGEPAKGAVVFALSMVGPQRAALPGPALVAILGALGFAEPTARSTILRMRREGRVRSIRRGPVAEYELTAPTRALGDEVVRPVVGQRPDWSGGFGALLFSVPERNRRYRDTLRRAAVRAGFGLLQPGLFICADDRRWARLEPVLERAPRGSRLTRAELRVAEADARAAAAEAWPLSELAERYRADVSHMRRITAEQATRPALGGHAIRRLWEAMLPLFATAAEDPSLPLALLPTDWPGDEMLQAVAEVRTALLPEVGAFLAELLAGRRP